MFSLIIDLKDLMKIGLIEKDGDIRVFVILEVICVFIFSMILGLSQLELVL